MRKGERGCLGAHDAHLSGGTSRSRKTWTHLALWPLVAGCGGCSRGAGSLGDGTAAKENDFGTSKGTATSHILRPLGGGYFHSWCPSSTDRGLATENPDRLGRSVGARAAPAAPQSRYRPTDVSFFTNFSGLRAHNREKSPAAL